MWHVRKHELEHLQGYRSRYPNFEQTYQRWVRSETPVEFEAGWHNISQEFKNYLTPFTNSSKPFTNRTTHSQTHLSDSQILQRESWSQGKPFTEAQAIHASHEIVEILTEGKPKSFQESEGCLRGIVRRGGWKSPILDVAGNRLVRDVLQYFCLFKGKAVKGRSKYHLPLLTNKKVWVGSTAKSSPMDYWWSRIPYSVGVAPLFRC